MTPSITDTPSESKELGFSTAPSGPIAAKNRIESDHTALKRLLGTRQSYRSLRSVKATIIVIEAIRTIKNGYVLNEAPGVRGEIDFVRPLFAKVA